MSDLTVVKTIDPPGWMQDTHVQTIMRILNDDEGTAPLSLFVGGAVRNLLLGKPVTDIDIATKLEPEAVIERCAQAGVKTVPTGIDHGTVSVIIDGQAFEVTTLRKDIETDGRHAVVGYTQDWCEDAQRRDFTMNTLLADPAGHIYDPTGCGVEDLEAGRVIFVGEAAERIEEDYLRALRFFRFHLYYGRGEPDETALQACADAAKDIEKLSRERITQEFFKILEAPDPADILSLIYDHGILHDLFGSADVIGHIRALCDVQQAHDVFDVPARLFVLVGQKDMMARMEQFLVMPKALVKDIRYIQSATEYFNALDEQSLKVGMYRYGRSAFVQAILIAQIYGDISQDDASKAVAFAKSWDVPVFPISGADLIKEGYKEGPELGQELARLEQEWIDRGFSD